MRRLWVLVLGVALGVSLCAGAAFAQGVIKIGANWPLADVSGLECSKAAQMAVDEINAAGGVLGRSSSSSLWTMRARETRVWRQ